MEFVPSSNTVSCEVTFDSPDLDVGMSVYDDSGPSPVLLSGPTAMILVANYTYRGKFVAGLNKNYIVIKAVYTDETFTTLDPNYSQGSESIVARNITPSGPVATGCSVIGIVDNNLQIVGRVICEN